MRIRKKWFGLMSAVAVAACSGTETGEGSRESEPATERQDDDEQQSVELFSWWLEGGERDALHSVLDLHEDTHENVVIVNLIEDNADSATELLEELMQEGAPPDTFQTNLGANLLDWVDRDDFDSTLLPLNDLADDEGWFDAFPDELLAAASRDGNLYGVPINVHRLNTLFYDKHLFEEHGLDVPTSIEELNELVVEIRENEEIQARHAGGVAPLALGNRYDWTLSLLTFEAVLPAVAGPDYFERFWTGQAQPSDVEIRDTLQEVLFLYCGAEPAEECRGYFNEDNQMLTWSEATERLVTGRAAMTVMGDWAKGYLEKQRLVADEDFGAVPFPGSQGTFVFTADTFPLTDGHNTERTRELLATFGSVDGQVVFNSLKGSIPARADIDLSDHRDRFDGMAVQTQAQFRNDRRVLATSGLLPTGGLMDLGPELKASMNAATIDDILAYLEDGYSALQ